MNRMKLDKKSKKGNGRLVLSRKIGERVIIGEGDNMTIVTVINLGRETKLAFESALEVNREEVAIAKGIIKG